MRKKQDRSSNLKWCGLVQITLLAVTNSIFLLTFSFLFFVFVVYRPLPEGMTVSSIGEEELETVISNWKYGANGGMGYARDQLAHFPSVVLKSECGEHVGHMLGYTFRTIGMLHVLPQFRRKGYAKVIISQLVQKYFDMGEDAYVNIEIDNEVSVKLHESLGFKAVPDMQITWVAHFPEDR